MRTIFLNQTGHRWKHVSYAGKSQRVRVYFPDTGEIKAYSVAYYEALGNYAIPFIRIKGKTEQLMEWDMKGMENVHAVNSERNRDIKWGRATAPFAF